MSLPSQLHQSIHNLGELLDNIDSLPIEAKTYAIEACQNALKKLQTVHTSPPARALSSLAQFLGRPDLDAGQTSDHITRAKQIKDTVVEAQTSEVSSPNTPLNTSRKLTGPRFRSVHNEEERDGGRCMTCKTYFRNLRLHYDNMLKSRTDFHHDKAKIRLLIDISQRRVKDFKLPHGYSFTHRAKDGWRDARYVVNHDVELGTSLVLKVSSNVPQAAQSFLNSLESKLNDKKYHHHACHACLRKPYKLDVGGMVLTEIQRLSLTRCRALIELIFDHPDTVAILFDCEDCGEQVQTLQLSMHWTDSYKLLCFSCKDTASPAPHRQGHSLTQPSTSSYLSKYTKLTQQGMYFNKWPLVGPRYGYDRSPELSRILQGDESEMPAINKRTISSAAIVCRRYSDGPEIDFINLEPWNTAASLINLYETLNNKSFDFRGLSIFEGSSIALQVFPWHPSQTYGNCMRILPLVLANLLPQATAVLLCQGYDCPNVMIPEWQRLYMTLVLPHQLTVLVCFVVGNSFSDTFDLKDIVAPGPKTAKVQRLLEVWETFGRLRSHYYASPVADSATGTLTHGRNFFDFTSFNTGIDLGNWSL